VIKIDGRATKESLRLLQAGIHQAAALALRQAVKVAEADARSTTLFTDRTGRTRASIRSETFAGRGWVEAGRAARFLEYGTRPHIIAARNAGTLAFRVNGQMVFRRSVMHPGTSERPFMRHARERGEQALAYALDLFIDAAIRGV